MLFFSDVPGTPLEVFGPVHLSLLLFVVAGVLLIRLFRDKLRRLRVNETLRVLFAAILSLNMIVYYGSRLILGIYDIRRDLPFEFCFITGFLLIYILLAKDRRLYRIVYYFTVIGPLPAILWPNLDATFDRYIFYQFFISHHVMLLISFYLLIVFGYRVRIRDALPAAGCAAALFASVFAFNALFGTNYIMQRQLPDAVIRLYPILTEFDHPVFWLLLCGIAALGFAALLASALQEKTDGEPQLLPVEDRTEDR